MKNKKMHEPYEAGDLVLTKKGLWIVHAHIGALFYRAQKVKVYEVLDIETKESFHMLALKGKVRRKAIKPKHLVEHLSVTDRGKLGEGLMRDKLQLSDLRIWGKPAESLLDTSPAYNK